MSNSEKRKWKSSLFGCCSYRSPTGECKWCPFFFPMSVMGTCCAAGRIVSKVEREDPIVCDMGCQGLACCFLSNALLGPPGWLILGGCLRSRVVDKFNVEEEGNPVCNCICYPCSYFQMLVSLEEWTKEQAVAGTGTSLKTPLV